MIFSWSAFLIKKKNVLNKIYIVKINISKDILFMFFQKWQFYQNKDKRSFGAREFSKRTSRKSNKSTERSNKDCEGKLYINCWYSTKLYCYGPKRPLSEWVKDRQVHRGASFLKRKSMPFCISLKHPNRKSINKTVRMFICE